jgi:hypothetical protein
MASLSESLPLLRPLLRSLSASMRAPRARATVWDRGLLEDEPCDALPIVLVEAIQKALPPGEPPEEGSKRPVAFLEGFSQQAGPHVHGTSAG